MTFDEAVTAVEDYLTVRLDIFGEQNPVRVTVAAKNDEILAAFAAMKTQRDALLAVVRDVEWEGGYYCEGATCPSCGEEATYPKGERKHAANCTLAAALSMEAS